MSRSHRRLAFEVSGGLDSSAIFAVAANLHRQGKLPAPDISGFTLKFDDDSEANELEYARAVGAHVGIRVEEVDPTKKPLSWYRDRARTYGEFPGYPNGIMGIGIREAARAQGCRVLFGGLGGDEWAGGSRAYYAEELGGGNMRSLYACIKTDCRETGVVRAAWWLGRDGVLPLLPAPARTALRKMSGILEWFSVAPNAWLTPEFRQIDSARMPDPAASRNGAGLGRAGLRRQHAFLFDAFTARAKESEERMAACLGMELRQPFWDVSMVQFSLSIPERLRLRGRTNKHLHRRAMTGLLPVRVLRRNSKAEFSVIYRTHAEELKHTLSADLFTIHNGWVVEKQLQKRYAQFGNPLESGEAEWMLWGLFGCCLLVPNREGG